MLLFNCFPRFEHRFFHIYTQGTAPFPAVVYLSQGVDRLRAVVYLFGCVGFEIRRSLL